MQERAPIVGPRLQLGPGIQQGLAHGRIAGVRDHMVQRCPALISPHLQVWPGVEQGSVWYRIAVLDFARLSAVSTPAFWALASMLLREQPYIHVVASVTLPPTSTL